MDPFVVISFGKKVFRTRVIRHSLNPVWDEKLLFHVRRYETSFKVQLTVLDWDKLSSNDYIGEASFDVSELLANAPQRNPDTGLYAEEEDGGHPMKEFALPLTTTKEMPWESKHHPILTFWFVLFFVIRLSHQFSSTAAQNTSHTTPSVSNSGVNI
jgi:phosphatidylserine decarboxylase